MTDQKETETTEEVAEQIPKHIRERFEQQLHEVFVYAEIDTVGVCHDMSRNDVRVILSGLVDDYLSIELGEKKMDEVVKAKLRIALTNMKGSWWSVDMGTAKGCALDMLDALHLAGILSEENWIEIKEVFEGEEPPEEKRAENFDPPTQLTID